MLTIRKAHERGSTLLDWLDGRHSFSFGDYYDPAWHNFRTLRVINDDRVQPGTGFGMHPHRDMEILTYIIEGSLAHKDSMDHGETIHAGEWQYMSAGTGVLHSEFNPNPVTPTHLLQIWIMPEAKGQKPRYQQKTFAHAKSDEWVLVASNDGRNESIAVRQDVNLWQAKLTANRELTYTLPAGRGGWLQVVRGTLAVNGLSLSEGDGLKIENEGELPLSGEGAEVLLFDLK